MKIKEKLVEYDVRSIIDVKDAEYIGGFKIEINFNDGTKRTVDFKGFLHQSHHPAIKKYLDEKIFKCFKIVDGNLNWNDYDLIFPVSDLYNGKIS